MTKEQKLYELSKELVYQMTGNYTEDTQNGNFQIAWTYLNKAMDFMPCCEQLKDKLKLTFDEYTENFYICNGLTYESKRTGKLVDVGEITERYRWYSKNL
jgi:hypothetical protein